MSYLANENHLFSSMRCFLNFLSCRIHALGQCSLIHAFNDVNLSILTINDVSAYLYPS